MQNPSQMQQDQQRRQWEQRTKTIVTIEAVAPTAESFTQLAQQFQQTPGLKEVSLRRESDGRPRIRIQAGLVGGSAAGCERAQCALSAVEAEGP
jgi:hypothetical protein